MNADVEALITASIQESIKAKQALLADKELLGQIADVACEFVAALSSGHMILLFGNGGSAADAQHLAAELTGRFLLERRSLPGLALSTNTSGVTAIGNDYGFDEVFARPLSALGAAGDVAFGLSTSGNSPNVLRAIEVAHAKQMVTIGLSGRAGKLATLAQHPICVPSDCTPRIQEVHILTGHILCEIIETELFANPGA